MTLNDIRNGSFSLHIEFPLFRFRLSLIFMKQFEKVERDQFTICHGYFSLFNYSNCVICITYQICVVVKSLLVQRRPLSTLVIGRSRIGGDDG